MVRKPVMTEATAGRERQYSMHCVVVMAAPKGDLEASSRRPPAKGFMTVMPTPCMLHARNSS